ncbi:MULTISPECIES: MurR/RpiR family transcriptional regulator [Collinsella]|uniref:MurR/RpiR family transcriptional regulator n=1 Tax=Collinsella ihumii TaxID=1720204 RepID=A0AAW7K3C8_9ACTN|nr:MULTISPECIES: MurR/RpiR family transcriptional regulator [Collinsella]MDN0070290.1 MurR/RpiR family transcriptional regulator [Collinsella ihumii]OUO59284.1 hypothetical protein B5F74_08860 [Collinsella sp. An271]
MQDSFYNHVKSGEKDLNDLEGKILRYIVSLRGDIEQATSKGIAAHFYVAPNTIVRLAHKLGFTGFTELKHSYLLSLERNRYTIETIPLDLQIIQTKDLVHDITINKVVDAIEHAGHIVFFCSGFSKYPCLEMAEKLKIMGKNTDTLSERHVMRHYAELLGPDDLVFSVSISGETEVSIDATSIAKSRGSKIVTMTGISKNSLSKLADIPLFTVEKQVRFGNMDLDSRLMFHYVFEMIFERFFERTQQAEMES